MNYFVDEIQNKFKNIYSIDLNNTKNIVIDNMVFPNYCVEKILNITYENDYRDFEYCRIINKIFGFNYNQTKLSYYETPEIKIEKNDIVFDCGANTGIFSLYSAYKADKVYAFEPSTLVRHYLKNTQNYNSKITIIPFGVSNENKEDFFYQTDNPGAARFNGFEIPYYHRGLYREKAKLTTIDNFVNKTKIIPTFIKMDIEDGEVLALEGAKNTLQKYAPKCSISIHEINRDKIDYIKSLFPNNYTFYLKAEPHYDLLLLGRPINA